MITLNGKKFAETEAEFTDSLFSKGGTCVGYVKGLKGKIKIMDHKSNMVGVITHHRVLGKATPLAEIYKDTKKKGYCYSYGDIEIIGRYKSYTQETEEIETALRHFKIKAI